VTAASGDAVLLDRRIWHTRSRNYSPRDDITPAIRASGLPAR
jgi:hypothetical protein